MECKRQLPRNHCLLRRRPSEVRKESAPASSAPGAPVPRQGPRARCLRVPVGAEPEPPPGGIAAEFISLDLSCGELVIPDFACPQLHWLPSTSGAPHRCTARPGTTRVATSTGALTARASRAVAAASAACGSTARAPPAGLRTRARDCAAQGTGLTFSRYSSDNLCSCCARFDGTNCQAIVTTPSHRRGLLLHLPSCTPCCRNALAECRLLQAEHAHSSQRNTRCSHKPEPCKPEQRGDRPASLRLQKVLRQKAMTAPHQALRS